MGKKTQKMQKGWPSTLPTLQSNTPMLLTARNENPSPTPRPQPQFPDPRISSVFLLQSFSSLFWDFGNPQKGKKEVDFVESVQKGRGWVETDSESYVGVGGGEGRRVAGEIGGSWELLPKMV